MQNSDPTSRSVLVQTTLRVAENEDEELLVVSDRGCQTVTTVSPDVQNANIVPLLEYTPYSEIVANSLKIYDLPRKYQLQFDLSGHHQRGRHPSIDGNVKSALKKNSSDVDEPGLEDEEGDEEIFYVQQGYSAQLEAMRKTKADEDIQTDLTVIPPVLDDDGIANVCTQLAVQTSITFAPDASLSRITPDLKTPMKHTNEYQAIMINGKIVRNYTDDGQPPPPRDEEDTEEETETTAPITDTDELTPTDTTSAGEEGMQAPQNTPNLQYSMTMTEEEFEKNVQRILEKTVANVYDFMAKIVEIYEQSKQALGGAANPEDREGQDQTTTSTKKPKMRSPSLILSDRQKAFKYLEEYHQGFIPPAQVELIELPDGSKLYNITQEADDLKIKVFETSVAKRMDDPTRILKLTETPKSREPKAIAERTDEQDEETEEPDREMVEQILTQIHSGAMDPTQYVVVDNVDGTKTFVVQADDGELEILEVADLDASDSELSDDTDQVGITTEEEPISTEEPTDPTQMTDDESTEFTATEPLVAGEETTEPLETTEPTTGEAGPSGPTGDIIGDSSTPHKGPEVQCECCIVKESGNAPPCLNELDNENVLTFELNIPTGSTVEKTFDGIKVKANISRPDQLKTEQIITVSVNVAGAEAADDSCSCSGDRGADGSFDKCEDCEGAKPKKSPKCDCPEDKEEDAPLKPEQPPTDLKSCDCSETNEVIKPPPEPEKCVCPEDEPPPLPAPKTSQKCVCPSDHKKEDLPPPPPKISQRCVCSTDHQKEDLPKKRPITPRKCDCSNKGSEDGITTSVSTLASDEESRHSTHTEHEATEVVSTCTCASRKPQHSSYDSESIIATCSCGNVTSAPEVAHKMEATSKNPDAGCDNICSKNQTVSIACGSDAPPKKRPVRINEELCECIRKELTQSRPTSADGCKCRGTSSYTRSHSCSCMGKEEYVEPEGICRCKPKPPPRPQTVSTPKVCQCNVKNVMDQLRQKTSCVKDSKMVEKHMDTLQPLLQKIGTGDSKPDARVSSVQVIYKKPDSKKSDKMCACNIQDVRGEAPPVTPMVYSKTKSCNCDLNPGVATNLAPLYQEEDEYNETYLDDMFENSEADGGKCACSSLPEVVTSTDRCGSRTEMPWMKIALPPPGTFEIQKIPKKGCQCGKQAPKPEPKQEYGQPPICRCREPRPTKPTAKCTCNRSDSSASAPCRCNICKCGGYIPKKRPPPPPSKDSTNPYQDMTCPELCDLKEDMKNSPQPPTPADVQQEVPSSDAVEPSVPAITRKCSCAKLQKNNDECEDTRHRIKMIYDDDNAAYNEEYMNPLCKMFADAADDTGECGINAEINWDEITIPKRVRLKQCPARKKMPTSYSEMSGTQQLPPMQQSMPPKQPPIPMMDIQKPSKQSRAPDVPSIIQLKLHFSGYTEVTSTIIPVVGGAQSQRTLTEYSEISDLRMQLKRCTPGKVATSLDPGFGVGSQPFAILGGQKVSAPFEMPSPGVLSVPQIPEKVSDLIGMFNYETASATPTPQNMSSVRGKQSVAISEGPQRMPVKERTSVRGKQSLCQPSDCGKYQAPKEPPAESTCPPEVCTKQEVCECSPTQGDDGSVSTMTSTEFREKYNLKKPDYKTEMFLEGKPMSMYTATEPGTEPYDPRMVSRLAEMNLRLTAADSLFGVTCSCERTAPPEIPQTPQIPKRRSKADCSCGKLIKGSKTKCVCARASKIRPQKQPKRDPPKRDPPCLCVEEALTKLKNPIITALETCEREMKPLHDTLNKLRSKVQSMDIPELDNWTAGTSLSSCYAAMYGKNKQQINFFVPETLGPFQQYSSNMQKKPRITSISGYNGPIECCKRIEMPYYGQKEHGKDTYLIKDREETKQKDRGEQGRNDIETTETSEKDASKEDSEEFNQRANKWEKRPCGKETKAIQNNNHPKLCEHCLRAMHKNRKETQEEYKRNETESNTTDETSNSVINKITKEIQQLVEESMGLGNIIKQKRNEVISTEGQAPTKTTVNSINHMRKDIENMVDESMALDKLHVDQKRVVGKQSVKSAKVTQSEFSISFCGLFTPVSSDTASSIVSDGKQKKIKELLNLGFDSKQSLSASSGDQITTCYQAASAPIQSHSEILLGNHFSGTADKNNGMPNNYPYVMHPYYPTNQHPGNYYPNMYNPYMFNYGPLCYNDMYNNPYQNNNYSSYLPCKMDERTKGKRSSSNASKTTSRSTTSVSSSDSTTVKSSATSTSTHSAKTSKTSNSDYPSTRDCDETTDIVDSLTDDAVDDKRVDAGDSPTTSYTKDSASKSQGRRKLVRITVKTTPSGNKIISKEEVFDSSTSTTYK